MNTTETRGLASRRVVPRLIAIGIAAIGVVLLWQWLDSVKRQEALEQLVAAGADVTDFAGRKSSVCLPKTADKAVAMPLLVNLSDLWFLEVRKPDFNDQDLARLNPLKKLELLALPDTQVTGEGFAGFTKHTQLYLVNVSGCPLSAKGLKHLSVIPSLDYLNAGRTNLTAKHLQAMQELKVRLLSVVEAHVDHVELQNLLKTGQIQEVDLTDTNLSMKEIDDLRAAVPQVKIHAMSSHTKALRQTAIPEDSLLAEPPADDDAQP
ncbi:hypothetical protein AB1L30_05385 [Bremerella sp. JC817]|uniref:hypothetical protein n=1 Tax=Bremerella sp. JC817 TaxID=3231756 RepID=UPI003458E109